MTTNASSQDLANRIKQFVREHIAVSRAVAKAAVEQAFADAEKQPTREPRQTQPRAKPVRTRTSEEVAALGEQFYVAVCQMPGETMMVLASHLGLEPKSSNCQRNGSSAQVEYAASVRNRICAISRW